MKARDFDLPLARAPVPHEGMSIARGGACAEIDEQTPLLAVCGLAAVAAALLSCALAS